MPLTYQWKKNGHDLPGAIRSSLTFATAEESDIGTYQFFVTQGATTVSSAAGHPHGQAGARPTSTCPIQDLVVHLKFDGNYSDSSGRNHHGTPQGAPQIVTGKIGSGALRVSTTVVEGGAVTTANYVSLGAPADLPVRSPTRLSVAFWIRFTGSPATCRSSPPPVARWAARATTSRLATARAAGATA